MMKTIVLICCVLMLRLVQSNIDTFEPIMRSSPEIYKTEKDLFGYTLVLHQMDVTGGVNNTRLVRASNPMKALILLIVWCENFQLSSLLQGCG